MMETGNFGHHVLLTGAGFSKDWGGRLAAEVCLQVYGDPALKRHENIRRKLIETSDYEGVWEYCLEQEPDAVTDLQNAITTAFDRMDRDQNQQSHLRQIADKLFWRMINGFRWNEDRSVDTGYIFTLNQDLLVERKYMEQWRCPALSIPFGESNMPVNRPPAMHQISGGYPNDLPFSGWKTDIGACGTETYRGSFNYIKLHGSANWFDRDKQIMIMGKTKESKIRQNALLRSYFALFEAVLSKPGTLLMIIGCSMNDEHIKAALVGAIQDHGLKVFVWNHPSLHSIQKACSELFSKDVFIGGSEDSIASVFRRVDPEESPTSEFTRISNEFFGRPKPTPG